MRKALPGGCSQNLRRSCRAAGIIDHSPVLGAMQNRPPPWRQNPQVSLSGLTIRTTRRSSSTGSDPDSGRKVSSKPHSIQRRLGGVSPAAICMQSSAPQAGHRAPATNRQVVIRARTGVEQGPDPFAGARRARCERTRRPARRACQGHRALPWRRVGAPTCRRPFLPTNRSCRSRRHLEQCAPERPESRP